MTHRFVSKRHWDYKITPLSKTDELGVRYDDIINLSVGDPDYPVDKIVIDKMYQDTLAGHTKYTLFLGDEDLRREICKTYKEDWGMDVSIDNLLITSGGTHALYLMMEAILDEGDEIIVISPYYIYYEPQIELPRGKVVVYETRPQDNFEVDVAELEKLVTPRTKAVLVNTPTNPTGRVYKEETIQGIIDLANRRDFMVLADDIYGAYNYTDRKKPICAYQPGNPRVATIYSFSKDYVMTGFRLGYILAEPAIIEAARNVNEAVNFTVNSSAQRAGIYCLQDRKRIQAGIREEYEKRVFYAWERLSKMKNIQCFRPEGTFYLFADIRPTGLASEEIWEKILDDAHVLVLPGNGFGDVGEGFIRIACTCGVDQLKIAFDRMEKMDIFR